MQRYQNVIIDTAGNAVPSVTVTVYAAGTTTPSTLFSDNGITSKANPYVTDATGNIAFYAANGRYDIKLTKTGYTFGTDLYDTILFDSVDYSPADISESALNGLRLIKSGSNLTLERATGSLININGTVRTMTTAPTVAPGGLTASTLYYLYAYWTGTDVGLATSETGYTVATATGRAEMTGDTLYRLVGIAYTTAGTAWADTAAQRFVRSYDNGRGVVGLGFFTAARATSSTSWVEVNTEIRVEFLSLPGDVTRLFIGGTGVYPTGAAGDCYTAIGIDGTTAEEGSSLMTQGSATYKTPTACQTYKTGLSTGYHYATLLGKKGGAATTAEWYGGASAELRVSLQVDIGQG